MDTREAAERFVRVWEREWAGEDAEAILALYAPDCAHRSSPFRPLHEGRTGMAEYVRWCFADEAAVDVRFGRPFVDGDVAVVEYRVFTVGKRGGEKASLAGCAFVRFNEAGLVVEARDYWNTADGHVEPAGRLFL